MLIAAYVSGHGFGHATRTCEVLRVLREERPELEMVVVGAAPEWLFRPVLGEPLTLRRRDCDVGVAQRDALTIDEDATLERWRAFSAGFESLVAEEAEWLRASGARLVLADVPPLGFAAAAAAGVPSVGLANFSWDWIYRHLARRVPGLSAAADACARAYRTADLLLELPFAGDLSVFPRRQQIGLVARRPTRTRAATRRLLGFDRRPAVLLSFGGLGLPGLDGPGFEALEDEFAIVRDEDVGRARLQGLGLSYEDVVGACDVVVTKPGYGIVSDAIAAGTRLVYTDRGDFPEYPILVEQMARYLPAVHVSNDALRRGALRDALRQVLALPACAQPDPGGAEAAAAVLRRMLEQVGRGPASDRY